MDGPFDATEEDIMSATHFHVLGGSTGCHMPDTNEVYEDFGSAFSAASELAPEFYGEATESWCEIEEPGEYACFKARRSGTTFATATIEVVACHDHQCEEGMGGAW